MPSALQMQVAYLAAANFCDMKASRDKDYEVLVERWQGRTQEYLTYAIELDNLVMKESEAV